MTDRMDRCLTELDFEHRLRGEMATLDLEHFYAHLSTCDRCRQGFDRFQREQAYWGHLRSAVQTTTGAGSAQSESASPAGSQEAGWPHIGGYEIHRLLGSGGMGVVYEATQVKLGRRVALKLLPRVLSATQPVLAERFRREAAAAAQLHHTHIIPIYDFGECRDGTFYAMELIRGQSLAVMIHRFSRLDTNAASAAEIAKLIGDSKSVPAYVDAPTEQSQPSRPTRGTGSTTGKSRMYYRQVASWMADAGEALHYAHLRGMVHRDIKPSNLMLTTDGRIVIVDFGLVKMEEMDSLTISGSILGTYRHMSPEQLGAGRLTVDGRSDVYSLGTVLYELLVFSPAYPQPERRQLFDAIYANQFTRPKKLVPGIPEDLETICMKAMESRPADRFASAQAMADDLRKFLGDLPISAKKRSMLSKGVKFLRRHRREAMTILSVFALFAAGHFTYRTYLSRKAEPYYRLGLDLVQEGKTTEAAAAFWDCLDVWPAHAECRSEWREVNKLFASDPLASKDMNDEVVSLQLNLAYEYYTDGKWNEAAEKYRQILSADPKNYPALVNLANCEKELHYSMGGADHLDSAESLLLKAIEVRPTPFHAYNSLGVIRRIQKDYTGAIEAFEKTREFNPDYYAVYINLGPVLALSGKRDDAIEVLRKGADLAERDPTSGNARALAYRNLAMVMFAGDLPEGAGFIDRALTTLPNDAVSLALNYLIKRTQEDAAAWDMVLADIDKIQRKSHRDFLRSRISRVAALALLHRGEWEKALTFADEAVKSGDTPAYGRLIAAIAEVELGRIDSAKPRLQGAGPDTWPDALRADSGWMCTMDQAVLWCDRADDLRQLYENARSLIHD